MALIRCPECGHSVSSVAKQCVRCGYPVGMIPKSPLVENILLDASIEQLNFSVRTYLVLHQEGYRTVRDIAGQSELQLMQIKRLGKKSLEEIISTVSALGIRLPDKAIDQPNVYKTATRFDWDCKRASENTTFSSFHHMYSPKELDILMRGYIPQSMEKKWFCYYENGTVYFYRSWTGKLVCKVILDRGSNYHYVIKYWDEEITKETVEQIDAYELTRCVIDGVWNDGY